MSTWLVTGASRGIGQEFVRQIVAGGDTVFATARKPSSCAALQQLQASSPAGRVHVVQLDVTNEQSIITAACTVEALLQDKGLDYIINSAALSFGNDLASNMKPQDLLDTFQSNVVGPALVFQAFLPALERSHRPEGPVVMNLTSGLGSIGLNCGNKNTSYSISKCALNMLTHKQAEEKPNIITFVLDPGWVKTDMGGPNAQLEIPFSVGHQHKVITSVTKKDSGTFKLYNGEELPW